MRDASHLVRGRTLGAFELGLAWALLVVLALLTVHQNARNTRLGYLNARLDRIRRNLEERRVAWDALVAQRLRPAYLLERARVFGLQLDPEARPMGTPPAPERP